MCDPSVAIRTLREIAEHLKKAKNPCTAVWGLLNLEDLRMDAVDWKKHRQRHANNLQRTVKHIGRRRTAPRQGSNATKRLAYTPSTLRKANSQV